MKTQKKTFEKIFLEISKPWIDAREAREKNWGFFRRFTRENRFKMVIFEGLKPAKSGLLAGPDFGNMKTLFQTFGRILKI